MGQLRFTHHTRHASNGNNYSSSIILKIDGFAAAFPLPFSRQNYLLRLFLKLANFHSKGKETSLSNRIESKWNDANYLTLFTDVFIQVFFSFLYRIPDLHALIVLLIAVHHKIKCIWLALKTITQNTLATQILRFNLFSKQRYKFISVLLIQYKGSYRNISNHGAKFNLFWLQSSMLTFITNANNIFASSQVSKRLVRQPKSQLQPKILHDP